VGCVSLPTLRVEANTAKNRFDKPEYFELTLRKNMVGFQPLFGDYCLASGFARINRRAFFGLLMLRSGDNWRFA
jgi:hypothetical protein